MYTLVRDTCELCTCFKRQALIAPTIPSANVAAEVQTVRSLVNKLGKAQRAAEETLEMCDD